VTRSLAERIVAIDGALADVGHAFGGALALAYYAEPRATIDIDVNVFVPPARFADVADRLAAVGVAAHESGVAEVVRRDGQARVWWDATPIDRPRDWVDIDAMVEAEAPIDVGEVLRWVGRIAGDADPRFDRIAAVLARR
jgi:hypothetical protein